MEQSILTFDHVTGIKRRFSLQNRIFKNIASQNAANGRLILQDISFDLKAGYIYGLVGENGAGKTTLMQYILRDTIPYEGHILIQGTDVLTDRVQVLNRIGYVSEDRQFFENCSAAQNAEILGALYQNFHKKTFLDIMDSMNLSAGKVYKAMSRGERLKFQLAFAIAHEPCLYLLDEVTAGMDPVFRIDFFHMLQQIIMDERACVLMTSHISSEIESKTDFTGVMENGRLVAFGESLDIIPGLKKRREDRQ